MPNLNGTVPESGLQAFVVVAGGTITTGPVTRPLSNERHAAFDAFLEGALLALANRPCAIACLVVHGKPLKSRINRVPQLSIRGTRYQCRRSLLPIINFTVYPPVWCRRDSDQIVTF